MLESSSSSDEEEDCASSVETSSSEETVARQVIKKEYQKRIDVMNHQALLGMAWSFGQTEKEKREKRVKVDGEVRDRPWRFIQSWSDKMFRAQFRLSRRDFDFVLSRLISTYAGPHDTGESNYRYACSRGDRSSGAHIKLEIKLCVTLRLLAGGSHLDMVWYGLNLSSVHRVFHEIVNGIDRAFPNKDIFKFPESDEEFEALSREWSEIMVSKYQFDFLSGTVLAGDGLVVPIKAPTRIERVAARVPDLANYRNRKGCYALIVQAFCDAYGKFRYFETRWPGSTNDVVAYRQTALYSMFKSGRIPSRYHMVLDEAYSSIGGDHHMCPFSRAQLKKAMLSELSLYYKMKGFNHMLSSQRITIERAFGMYVRRWGILWKPLEYSFVQNMTIINVCAKLHNLCIDSWKQTHVNTNLETMTDEYRQFALENMIVRDSSIFVPTIHQTFEDESNEQPDDNEVMDTMGTGNYLPENERCATVCAKKQELQNFIWQCNFRVTNVDGLLPR